MNSTTYKKDSLFMSRDKKEGKKNNNKRNNNDGRSNRRISFAAKDEIIYPHTETYLNDKNYYVPKKKGVTPFRLEAQERIRQLSYNVEVSKRLREMKDKNFHQLVNCGIDLHYQSSSMITTRKNRKKKLKKKKTKEKKKSIEHLPNSSNVDQSNRLSSGSTHSMDEISIISRRGSSELSIVPFNLDIKEEDEEDHDDDCCFSDFGTHNNNTTTYKNSNNFSMDEFNNIGKKTSSIEIITNMKSVLNLNDDDNDNDNDDEYHPIYGKLLCDLGFKKLYLASARSVINNIPIWHLQRPCDKSRIAEIVRVKKNNLVFPGCISVFEIIGVEQPRFDIPQNRGIFDGQHRVYAASEILNDKNASVTDFQFTLEIFPVNTNDEVKDLFLELNKSERVQEIDLPDVIAPSDKGIIDGSINHISRKYRQMFKPTQRCRKPHLNRDYIRNEIHQTKMIKRYNINNVTDMINLLEQINAYIGNFIIKKEQDVYDESFLLNITCTERAKKKAKEYKFYLGLTKDWLHLDLHSKIKYEK